MARIRELITIPRVLGLIVVPALSYAVGHWWGSHVLTALLMTIYVTVLFAAVIEHRYVPRPYLAMRDLHDKAFKKTRENAILGKYYDERVEVTRSDLESIVRGKIELSVSRVPQLSIEAMGLVDAECILTFPIRESEALLMPRSGPARRYYKAMVEASRRLSERGGPGIVRVFMLRHQDQIDEATLDFMKQNVQDGIDVRVLYEEDAPARSSAIESLDFGYYELSSGQRWVMILTKEEDSPRTHYVVETDPQRVGAYRVYGQEVQRVARSLKAFLSDMLRPVNSNWPLYFADKGFEMDPPHGLSDEDADVIVGSLLKRIDDPQGSKVAVLGFTPKLIRRLQAAKVKTIVSIDQSDTRPQEFRRGVTFCTCNWLEKIPDDGFDGVVFDESINNLTRLQLGTFFSNISAILKPGGLLSGRVMGRYDSEQVERYSRLTKAQVVNELRKIEGKRHSDYAPLIICFLHAQSMAFDFQSSSVLCSSWNETLSKLRDDQTITPAEYEVWKLAFQFRLLSPEPAMVVDSARKANFSLIEMKPVDGLYAHISADTLNFYRIFSFEKVGASLPSADQPSHPAHASPPQHGKDRTP